MTMSPIPVLLLGLLLLDATWKTLDKFSRMFTVGLFAALVLAVLMATPGAVAVGDGIHIPPAHVGDASTYAPAGEDAIVLTAGWLPQERTQDRWGQPGDAYIYQVKAPAEIIDRAAWTGAFADAREAFAMDGHGPLWRSAPLTRVWETMGELYRLPIVYLAQPGSLLDSKEKGVTTVHYDPSPSLLSCMGHHGLQGRGLTAGAVVPLATLCPPLTAVSAEASPARATTFQGHAALELAYDIGDGGSAAAGVERGTRLRVVVADGLSFLAAVSAEALTAEARSFDLVLTGSHIGQGAEIPHWRPDLRASEAPTGFPSSLRFEPLGAMGPADGGAGLPYALGEALQAIGADANLSNYQPWQAEHPRAFLLVADFAVESDGDGGSQARWLLTFADPRSDGWTDTISVVTQRNEPERRAEHAGWPASFITSADAPDKREAFRSQRPSGQPVLDIGSAVAASARLAPEGARSLPVSRVFYLAPAPVDLPPLIGVERGGAELGAAGGRASVVLDASSGAANQVAYFSMSTGDVYVPPPDPLPGIEFATGAFVLAALVFAVLARLGHVAVFYTRLRHSDLLDHPRRRAMYEIIRRQPGVHFQGIAAAAGLHNGTAMYHMRVLQQGGLVTEVRLPGYTRYYLTGTLPTGVGRTDAVLQAGSARQVYDVIRARPGVSLSDVARTVQVSPPAVHKTVAHLERAGLVEKRSDGRAVRLTAREETRRN